jgi:hypothetical protein
MSVEKEQRAESQSQAMGWAMAVGIMGTLAVVIGFAFLLVCGVAG